MSEHSGGAASVSRSDLALAALLDDAHPIKVAAAEWAESHLSSTSSAFDRADVEALAEFGAQGQLVPTALGGTGSDIIEALLTFEGLALGSANNGLIFAIASQVFAMQRALLSAATHEQRQRWLPALCSGSAVGAFAMTEIDAGSDSSAIQTSFATIDETAGAERYLINGSKTWITAGPVADRVIVFATKDPGLGRWGITAFCVEADRDGITQSAPIEKMGLTGSPFGTIDFHDVEVSADDRLGPEGSGASIFSGAVEGERAFLYACQLGSGERVLTQTIDRARRREQFGKPIGANQAVAHRIAEMKLRLEASRLLVYKAAALASSGRSVSLASALAKIHTSEATVANSIDALGIHGAQGYTTQLPIEQEVRDALGGLAYSGTSDIQRMIVARLLGVERPVRKRSP